MPKPKSTPPQVVNWPRVAAITAITVAGFALFGWYDRYRLPDMIGTQTSGLEQKMAALDGKLDVFLNSMLRKVASHTGDPAEINEDLAVASEIISTAQARGVVLKPQLVSDVGKALIDLSASDTTEPNSTQRWNTAMQFVSYQTFINGKTSKAPNLPKASAQVTIRFYPGESGTVTGYAIENTNVVIDNGKWVNILFTNCTITFEGGPTALENVYFVNCRFVIIKNETGYAFARSIFGSNPVVTTLGTLA